MITKEAFYALNVLDGIRGSRGKVWVVLSKPDKHWAVLGNLTTLETYRVEWSDGDRPGSGDGGIITKDGGETSLVLELNHEHTEIATKREGFDRDGMITYLEEHFPTHFSRDNQ